jgi:Rieske Fe-S protein
MLSRRAFLKVSAFFAGLALTLKPAFLFASKKMAIPLAKVEKLKTPGNFAMLKLKDKSYLFIRDTETSVKVFDGLCTHKKCDKLSYDSASKKIQCGCHESNFDLDGKVLKGPATTDLPKYEAVLENNEKIILTLPE